MITPGQDPGLPDVVIASQAPFGSDSMLIMGEGYAAGVPIASGCTTGGNTGYLILESHDVPRWGLNTYFSGGLAFFDALLGEATLAFGDSGGPAWYSHSGNQRWELFGIAYSSDAGSGLACMRDSPLTQCTGTAGCAAEWSVIANGDQQLQGRLVDSDADGIPDFLDNCPVHPNPNQHNSNNRPYANVSPQDGFEYLWGWIPSPFGPYPSPSLLDGKYPPVAGNVCDGDFNPTFRTLVSRDWRIIPPVG